MRVFIDASVILAALGSKRGGSAFVLQLIKDKKVEGVTSQSVLEEVIRNAPKIGIGEEETVRFISSNVQEIISGPTSAEVETYVKKVDEKDAHIITSAIKSKTHIILTLDKKHLLSKRMKGFTIITPGQLLKQLTEK